MTIQIFSFMPVEVFADARLTLTQLRVLGVIYSFRSKDTNIAFPKREAISKRCGISVTKISTATTALENYGWLKKTGKGGFGLPVQYRVCFPETIPSSGTVAESGTVTKSGTTTMPESGTRTNGEQTSKQTNNHRVRTRSLTSFPEDMTPTEKHRSRASESGLDIEREFDKFKNHHMSKGSKFSDWNAALNNWLLKAAEFSGGRTTLARSRVTTTTDFSNADYGQGVMKL